MIRRKLGKKITSGVLAMALFMSFLTPQSVEAYYNFESVTSVKELAEKYKLDMETAEIEVARNPIREGVDTTSEEYQAIIVEFNSLPLIMQQSLNNGVSNYKMSKQVNDEHKQFENFLNKNAKERNASAYSIDFSYYNTFNGVAMKVKGTDINSLLDSGVVKAIWNDEEVKVDPVSVETNVDYATSNNNPNSRMASSTPLIGVDKLREEGLTGKGIKVGVLDTGIDYNHPDLKSNYKGGYDFIDNDNDPMETTYEDWKNSGINAPAEEYITSHGTHVAGTVAATGENTESEFAVTGIAPEADIYAYRVLGPSGSGATSGIIAGIEKSVEDEMDVINLSLGSTTTDILFPTSVACNNATLAGVVTVVANGNSGPNFSTLGAPGTSPLSISVGASSTYINVPNYDITLGNGASFSGPLIGRSFESLDILVAEEYEIVYAGLGYESSYDGLDVEGKIVLLDRGDITFYDKHINAANAGALGIIIANNVPGELNLYLGEFKGIIPSIGITTEQGLEIKEYVESVNSNEEVATVKLTGNGTTTTEGDVLSEFSSRGPASDETIKPDIVAPGEAIFSTYPEFVNHPEDGEHYQDAYSRISGTSMATPHVAGIVALMLQNDSDLTPEEVKVALMNTSVDLKGDYPINAVGAGRVDAYRAVHNDVSISVNDTCSSTDENSEFIELEYITGSLSFDRIYITGEDNQRTLDLTIKNDGESNKNFNVSVSYLGEAALAQDAEANGVALNVPSELSVESGSSVDFQATINIPANADLGRYEGYVVITNVDDSNEVYKVPFSASYVKAGLRELSLSRYSISNDLEMMHFIKDIGITAYAELSSPLDYMEVYVKDYETEERIGLARTIDLSYIPPGYGDAFYILDGRASYFPIDENGNISYIKSSLVDGKYKLEVIAHSSDTDEVFEYEYPILVDNIDVDITMDKEPGVYEISDDMYTVEDFMGGQHNAFWIHGNVNDNSIEILQDMGYEYGKEDLVINGFLNGMPYFGIKADENGDFKVGFEPSDLENGVIEFSPMPTDMATSQNLFLPPRYFFVKEGSPYSRITLDKDSMEEGENVKSTIAVKNLVNGSTFKYTLNYLNVFEVMDIKIHDELQKILDENGYTARIEKQVQGDINKQLQLDLYVTDKDGNNVNVSGDIALIDIDFKLVDESDADFHKGYIESRGIEVLDKDNNIADMSFKVPYEGVDIKRSTSTIRTVQIAQGFIDAMARLNYSKDLDKYIWAEDNNGNKYELEYNSNNDEFVAKDLPVSTEEFKIVTNLPGHFRKVANFVPSRVVNGEVVGRTYYLLGSEFYTYAWAGDTNQDDVIDIHDAIEVAKYYGQKVDYNEVNVDFNFDGIVNADDMDYVIYNFLYENEQNSNKKAPEETFEGKTLENVLEEIGYYNEVRLEELSINETELNLELNDPTNNTAQLVATMNPENVPNIELVWKSRCEDIVTVDQTGLVTAVNAGSTIVEVGVSDGSAILYCLVTVTKDGVIPQVETVVAEDANLEVFVGDEFDFNFTVNPEDVVVKSVEFTSSADSIVSVVDGKGIAKQAGKAIVTAMLNEGEGYVTWEVTVKEKDDNNGGDGNGDGNGDGGNNGGNGDGNGDGSNGKPDVDVKPEEDKDSDKDTGNGKLPNTGGAATLPIVATALTLVAGGVVISKKKK